MSNPNTIERESAPWRSGKSIAAGVAMQKRLYEMNWGSGSMAKSGRKFISEPQGHEVRTIHAPVTFEDRAAKFETQPISMMGDTMSSKGRVYDAKTGSNMLNIQSGKGDFFSIYGSKASMAG
eukprot:CAMPEP_0119526802 /NCGR_PEP_ID=MMETSP1344-20130328/41345_1 /TAXON_ID=236787 /ORGANISM="Florenciella parvula, Strain CCMP2471" /LENGTH=121 /DNA_ID=CAMNT_0007565875 /DNA_START=146 /DNA_END=507 /DNA_ORIENTATION=+